MEELIRSLANLKMKGNTLESEVIVIRQTNTMMLESRVCACKCASRGNITANHTHTKNTSQTIHYYRNNPRCDHLEHDYSGFSTFRIPTKHRQKLRKLRNHVQRKPITTSPTPIKRCQLSLRSWKLNTNKNLKKVRVWVYETENTYATEEIAL